MHILLVEDNPGDIALFREALSDMPMAIELSVATDGEEALGVLRGQRPAASSFPVHLIVLDLNLPRKDGFAVLAELQSDPERQYLPVVVFSSAPSPEDVNRCYELGANAFMLKPLDLELYLRKIRATARFWQACRFRTLAGNGT